MNETSITTNATTALHERTTASEAVVNAVADEEGISPVDVRPPLYEVIDPDALDELASSMNRFSDQSPGRIVFSYAGYEVTVAADGEVSVAEGDSKTDLRAWRTVYGGIECGNCGYATVGKVVGDVAPAGRDSCPECGGVEFSVVE